MNFKHIHEVISIAVDNTTNDKDGKQYIKAVSLTVMNILEKEELDFILEDKEVSVTVDGWYDLFSVRTGDYEIAGTLISKGDYCFCEGDCSMTGCDWSCPRVVIFDKHDNTIFDAEFIDFEKVFVEEIIPNTSNEFKELGFNYFVNTNDLTDKLMQGNIESDLYYFDYMKSERGNQIALNKMFDALKGESIDTLKLLSTTECSNDNLCLFIVFTHDNKVVYFVTSKEHKECYSYNTIEEAMSFINSRIKIM